jgi:hypothetical protein
MKSSVLLAGVLCLLTDSASAENQRLDLRDPSIWTEEATAEKDAKDPCEVFQSSVCPGYGDGKTDIQKEQQRREANRRYKDIENGKWRE